MTKAVFDSVTKQNLPSGLNLSHNAPIHSARVLKSFMTGNTVVTNF